MRSNYVTSSTTLGTGYAFIFLGIITVAIRFAVRKWKRVSIGPDDWLSLAALVFVISYCITMIYGQPQENVVFYQSTNTFQARHTVASAAITMTQRPKPRPKAEVVWWPSPKLPEHCLILPLGSPNYRSSYSTAVSFKRITKLSTWHCGPSSP